MRSTLLRLGVVACAFRLIFILIFPGPNYFEGISRSYLEVADNVLEGRGLVTYVDIAPLTSPEPHWSYEPFIDRPLGYLFLILVPYAISGSPIAIQVLHAVLSSFSTVLLFLLARRLMSERSALIAAWLYALWPLSARFEIAVLPDSVMSFFLLLSLYLLIRGTEKTQPSPWYFAAGLSLGTGMTMRPDILLLPFFLAAPFLFFRPTRSHWRGVFLMFVGVTLIVGGHTVRNYRVTGGEILPLGLGNGISMWEGISQFGDTLGTLYGDERLAQLEGYKGWAYPDGIERDRKRFREAIGIILDHPIWYTGVMLKRLPVLLTPDWIMTRKFTPSLKQFLDENPRATVWEYASKYPLATLIRIALLLLQYATLFLALFATLQNLKNFPLFLPAVVIFYYIIIHIPTNTEARYFYPAIPFVLLLASHGWEIMRQKRAKNQSSR
jgi:4-amino-4-deoxy-L-arabinose transferase-like glycosyltransferase